MYNVTVKDPNALGWLSWPGINLNMGVALCGRVCGRVYVHNQHLQYTNISWIWFHWPSNHTNRLFQLFTCFVTLFPNSSDSRCSFTVFTASKYTSSPWNCKVEPAFWVVLRYWTSTFFAFHIAKKIWWSKSLSTMKMTATLNVFWMYCIISKASQIFKWGFLEQVKCSHITLQPKTGSHWS